ncbi:MAG TPA: cytochrome P460 family protein [Polyangiaceae bacterium]|nr:cytochrome P460 family protein [Polyangiaceae bacterium]
MRLLAARALALLLAGCADTPSTSPSPVFPADYADRYVEVRSCRKSADHELEHVRVLADSDALGPYEDRSGDFPDGAIVLKEQYDASDSTCSGPIAQWTVMQKNGEASTRLNWNWQRVTANRRVVETNAASCHGCHAGCSGEPQAGYDFTCADP